MRVLNNAAGISWLMPGQFTFLKLQRSTRSRLMACGAAPQRSVDQPVKTNTPDASATPAGWRVHFLFQAQYFLLVLKMFPV